jgi:hypothetical protein
MQFHEIGCKSIPQATPYLQLIHHVLYQRRQLLEAVSCSLWVALHHGSHHQPGHLCGQQTVMLAVACAGIRQTLSWTARLLQVIAPWNSIECNAAMHQQVKGVQTGKLPVHKDSSNTAARTSPTSTSGEPSEAAPLMQHPISWLENS